MFIFIFEGKKLQVQINFQNRLFSEFDPMCIILIDFFIIDQIKIYLKSKFNHKNKKKMLKKIINVIFDKN